jgi:PAS domain S-box-containing protein
MSEHKSGVDIPERRQAEQTQQRTDELFRALIENALDVITIIDTEGVIRFQSPSLERVLGYRPAESIGVSIVELLHPDDVPKVNAVIKAAASPNGTPGIAPVLDTRFRHKDGAWRILESIVKALPSGLPVTGIVINSRDITERKRSEEVLRFQAAVLVNVNDAIVASDAEFRLTIWNAAAESLYGWKAEQVLGQLGLDITQTEYPDVDKAEMLRIIAEIGRWRGEVTQARKDGTRIPVEISSMVLHDDNGRITGYVSVNRDITERMRAKQVIASLAKFPAENPNPVLRLSRDGIVVYANAAGDALLGMWGCAVGGTAPQFWHDLAAQALVSGENRTVDVALDGKVYSMFATPVAGEGYMNLYGRDITEQKRTEAQVQRQLQRLAALREIDMAIAGSVDLQVTLGVVLPQVIAQLGADAADVLLLNPHTQTLEYVVGRGFRTDALRHTRLRLGDGFAGRAALERHVVHVPNLSQEKDSLTRSPRLDGEGFVAYYAAPLIAKGMVKCVLEVFHRVPFSPDGEWLESVEALAGQAAIAMDSAELFGGLQRANLELIAAYDATIEGWSRALDLRDKETEGHTLRCTQITLDLARAMGVSEGELVHVRRGALLHDIGKLGVPDSILLKPSTLTDEEWVVMRKHPVFAYDMLLPITYLLPALDIPYGHHEKWDGSGYPRGLKGERIPRAARIFAVVDVWDAFISDRPYRPAWPKEKARAYVQEQAGKHFDPKVVDAFLAIQDEIPTIRTT